jgi:hypothetical protein
MLNCTSQRIILGGQYYADIIVPVRVKAPDALLINTASVHNPEEIPTAHDPNDPSKNNPNDPTGSNNSDSAVATSVPVVIGDFVWDDFDRDGIQDA